MADNLKYTNTTLGGSVTNPITNVPVVGRAQTLRVKFGGALDVATHVLALYIPAGSLIIGAWLHTITNWAGAGATIIVQTTGGSANLIASKTATDLDADGIAVGVPCGSEAAANAPVLIKTDTTVEVVVGTAATTAGLSELIVEYIPTALS